jgi:hypothetical protein
MRCPFRAREAEGYRDGVRARVLRKGLATRGSGPGVQGPLAKMRCPFRAREAEGYRDGIGARVLRKGFATRGSGPGSKDPWLRCGALSGHESGRVNLSDDSPKPNYPIHSASWLHIFQVM